MFDWVERARNIFPAGGYGNFDPSIVIERGDGAFVWDTDGKKYIDYLIGSGPMILGHNHPEVVEAVIEQMRRGQTFFANNTRGIELAEEICKAVACAEQIRFVSTGGEADMYAMRLARAYTGRDKIVKFEGGYHGMSAEAQMSLFPTGPANYPYAAPDSSGIPAAVCKEVLVAPFNNAKFVSTMFDQFEGEIAGVIVEPLQRLVPPATGFLEELRRQCTANNAILIFDEIVTGFRFAYGGAQELYGVTPDLCTLGKIIGGGFPLAAIAGSKEIMAHFDKTKVGADKFLVQIGTLSGNPVAAVAGLKTLEILRRPGQYELLRSIGEKLMAATVNALKNAGIDHRIVGDPTLFDVVFTSKDVVNYRDGLSGDAERNSAYNNSLRESGILKSPGKMYPSLALSDEDIVDTVNAISVAANAIN